MDGRFPRRYHQARQTRSERPGPTGLYLPPEGTPPEAIPLVPGYVVVEELGRGLEHE